MNSKLSEFQSFFWGGFECADHINKNGIRINLQTETEHRLRVFEDYQLLKSIGIRVVREGICWSLVEIQPYVFDFSRLLPFYKAAEKLGIQIIWDLCHFGFPSDLVPTHPKFSDRFEALAEAFCKFHAAHTATPLYVIPINEISFLSWLSGEARGTVPFTTNSGWEIKYHLCKAKIRAIKIIKSKLPNAVILTAEPLIKVHTSKNSESAVSTPIDDAQIKHEYQYQTMDILLGRMCPELGGSEDLIDFMGVNYYYNNQWNHQGEILPWPDVKKERIPFSELLMEVYGRYQLPMIITETGHFGKSRSQWMREICNQTRIAVKKGAKIHGICIYPVIDRPDWDDISKWCFAGIWDLDAERNRIPNLTYLRTMNRLENQFSNSQKVLK